MVKFNEKHLRERQEIEWKMGQRNANEASLKKEKNKWVGGK